MGGIQVFVIFSPESSIFVRGTKAIGRRKEEVRERARQGWPIMLRLRHTFAIGFNRTVKVDISHGSIAIALGFNPPAETAC
jgi:hypothetical protein